MKNTNLLLIKLLFKLTLIFICGIIFPLLISLLISLFNNIDISEYINTTPFWLFSFFGWLTTIIYIHDSKNINNSNKYDYL